MDSAMECIFHFQPAPEPCSIPNVPSPNAPPHYWSHIAPQFSSPCPHFIPRYCVPPKKVFPSIFPPCASQSQPANAFPLKSSKNSKRVSDWKYWTPSAPQKCCTCFFRPNRDAAAPEAADFQYPATKRKL